MIAIGMYRIVVLGDGAPPPAPLPGAPDPLQPIGLLLILRAFASGSVALTGTEAIANGVPAFKPPEPTNAATTLTIVAVLLAVLFIGITFVADSFGIVPIDEPAPRTVISQVAATVFGDGSIGFYLFQTFTALILFLAANTSYNAFPRLAAILARDGYMPRQFSFRGDRLAFTSGIVVLSLVAIALLVVFQGNTTALIPLYSVGVFVSFTISQGGMVRHWLAERSPGWRWKLAVNGFGCALTALVAVIVTVAKAPTSLLVAIVIPILVAMMLFIHRQYRASAQQLEVRPDAIIPRPHREERVVVPVPGINRAVVQAVNVGRSIADDVRAVLVSDEPEEAAAIRARWDRQLPDVPLVIVESPYRALVGPMLAYLDVLDRGLAARQARADHVRRRARVRRPKLVGADPLQPVGQPSTQALLGRAHTVVVNVPYRREDTDESTPGADEPTTGEGVRVLAPETQPRHGDEANDECDRGDRRTDDINIRLVGRTH